MREAKSHECFLGAEAQSTTRSGVDLGSFFDDSLRAVVQELQKERAAYSPFAPPGGRSVYVECWIRIIDSVDRTDFRTWKLEIENTRNMHHFHQGRCANEDALSIYVIGMTDIVDVVVINGGVVVWIVAIITRLQEKPWVGAEKGVLIELGSRLYLHG